MGGARNPRIGDSPSTIDTKLLISDIVDTVSNRIFTPMDVGDVGPA